MDGKNVYDFVDKDILKKVEALEAETEENNNNWMGLDDDDDNDEESSELSEDLVEAH